jgi:hypothetical protein
MLYLCIVSLETVREQTPVQVLTSAAIIITPWNPYIFAYYSEEPSFTIFKVENLRIYIYIYIAMSEKREKCLNRGPYSSDYENYVI